MRQATKEEALVPPKNGDKLLLRRFVVAQVARLSEFDFPQSHSHYGVQGSTSRARQFLKEPNHYPRTRIGKDCGHFVRWQSSAVPFRFNREAG